MEKMIKSPISFLSEVAQLTDHLFLCAARALKPKVVYDKGITCIINATVELPNLPLSDVDYVKVAVEDSPYEDISRYFDMVADKIHEVKKFGGKTLVHCIAGVSRSTSLCLAYLVKYEGMTLRKAYQHVKAKRPIVHPNQGFFKQLVEYEKKETGEQSVTLVDSVAGIIPDLYEAEYLNLVWFSPYRKRLNGTTNTKM